MLEPYALTDEEAEALTAPDIGKLYVLGVNGQIMHFAAFHQIEQDYLQRMRDGVDDHGPVRVCTPSPAMRNRAHSERSGRTEEWVMDPTQLGWRMPPSTRRAVTPRVPRPQGPR